MLEVGQIFNKDGYNLCVLDIIDYDMRKYVLFSVEKEKMEYIFYEIVSDQGGYELKRVYDDKIEFALFNIVENSKE